MSDLQRVADACILLSCRMMEVQTAFDAASKAINGMLAALTREQEQGGGDG